MIRRIWIAYTVELGKVLQLKHTYVGPLLVVLAVLCAPLVRPVFRDGASDYGFIAYVTPLALGFLGFFMLLVFCGTLVSQELASGSLRQVLVRPIHRHEYLASKLLIGMTYATILTVLTVAGSWSVAYFRGELRGVTYGGELVYTGDQMWWSYALGALLVLAPLWAGVAYAVLFSTLTRSPIVAISSAVGLWLALDMIKYPLGIDWAVFWSYLDRPWEVFTGRCDAIEFSWFPMVWYCLGVSAITMAVCAALAMVVFHRRNLSA